MAKVTKTKEFKNKIKQTDKENKRRFVMTPKDIQIISKEKK